MISSQVEGLIIQNYILGHSRDEIATETGVAPGSVSNKVNEWKRRIDAPDIEELRRFAVNMRKSGMTIKQCTKGFRFLQLLKRLEIIIENDDIDSDLDSLSYFVDEMYKKCKEVGITPTVVTAWIDDLLNFSTENYGYLYENSRKGTKVLLNKNQNSEKKPLTFVSVISDFIEQKKRELGDLSKKGKKIGEEINQYTFQKKELIQRIQTLILKNESVVEDLSTFSILNKTLLEEYGIDLKKDPRPFTKLLYDYKENGYDMMGIIEEYNKGTNLRLDIIQKESLLQSCENQLIKLQKNIKAHESILDSHRKNWDTYQHLEAMKFGIDELQQLRSTVSEIARNRDMSREDAVAIFFKDVEDNYYNKVKFEDKVNARRNELSTIIAELNSS